MLCNRNSVSIQIKENRSIITTFCLRAYVYSRVYKDIGLVQ